jgi:hypothetical protein
MKVIFTVSLVLTMLTFTQTVWWSPVVRAQTATPATLPLTLEGTGAQVSVPFAVSNAWQVQVPEGQISSLYLYDVTTGKNLRKLISGEVLEQPGAFFIYVVAADTASWQITIGEVTTFETNNATSEAGVTTTTATESTTATAPATTASRELPAVANRTLQNWARHFGLGVNRFTRTSGATPGNCETFANMLEAQKAFIEAGGPDLDPNNLDVDGDGYACAYSPVDPSYAAAMICATGTEWINPRYRKNDTYFPGGCRPGGQ